MPINLQYIKTPKENLKRCPSEWQHPSLHLRTLIRNWNHLKAPIWSSSFRAY